MSRSYSLGLLLPRKNVQSFSPHAMGMFHGVADAISKSDYNLPLFFGWSEKLEETLRQHRLDGLMIMARMQDSPVYEKLNQLDIPVLCLNRRSCGADVLSVMTDMNGWADEALAAFAKRGYRRARLYASDPKLLAMDVDLSEAFPKLCEKHGLSGKVMPLYQFDGKAQAGTAYLFRGNMPLLKEWFTNAKDAARRTVLFCAPEKCIEEGYPLECCSYHNSTLLGETGVRFLMDAIDKKNSSQSLRLPFCRAIDFKSTQNTIMEDF